MRWVKLTDDEGFPRFINLDEAQDMQRLELQSTGESLTRITMAGSAYLVKETPEEIISSAYADSTASWGERIPMPAAGRRFDLGETDA